MKTGDQIRMLKKISRRVRPGTVPGALVDVTTGGTFVRPIARPSRGGGSGPARWM
jgi:hypothetical protein